MKFVLSLTLSFLLFAFITISDCQPVVDSEHEQVFEGYRYSILSANPASGIDGLTRGGGLSLGKTGDLECPVTILQIDNNLDNGFAVQFIIHNYSFGIVTTHQSLQIEFMPKFIPKCAESGKWLVYVDNITKKVFLGIGGPGNYPGKQIMNGTFGIREFKATTYKFVFCDNGGNCLDIGRFDNHEGGRRLNVPNNEPFEVVFQRAPDKRSVT